MFVEAEHPGIGSYLMPASPLRFSRASEVPVRRAPLLGEDTDEVLAGVLGLKSREIEHLHQKAVVAGPFSVPVTNTKDYNQVKG